MPNVDKKPVELKTTEHKSVLVAGATGYLGKFVVTEFKRRGYWVRVLVRNVSSLEAEGPFTAPVESEEIAVSLSASIGIAIYPDHGQDFDSLQESSD